MGNKFSPLNGCPSPRTTTQRRSSNLGSWRHTSSVFYCAEVYRLLNYGSCHVTAQFIWPKYNSIKPPSSPPRTSSVTSQWDQPGLRASASRQRPGTGETFLFPEVWHTPVNTNGLIEHSRAEDCKAAQWSRLHAPGFGRRCTRTSFAITHRVSGETGRRTIQSNDQKTATVSLLRTAMGHGGLSLPY